MVWFEKPVSYTHLDVYKRQGLYKPLLNFCKIDDQIAVIDPHRNLIVESIRMRLVTFFKEITQDRFCLRIYNPIFTYAGILVRCV